MRVRHTDRIANFTLESALVVTPNVLIAPLSDRVRDAFPRLLLVVFLSGAMRGYSMPYLNLYLNDIGYSGTLIGTVVSIAALIELVLVPLVSKWADRTRTHRLLFRLISLAYLVACLSLIALPLRVVVVFSVLVLNVSVRTTFLYSMQLSFTKLQNAGKKAVGNIRAMSAGGFMVANATAGIVFGFGQYVALYIFATISGLLSLFFSDAMPENTAEKPQSRHSSGRSFSPALWWLFAAQFFVTMGIRNGFTFWLVHFQENLGMTTGQISLVVTLSAVFEIPFFFAIGRFLQDRDATRTYLLGSLSFGVVWVLIGMASGFGWVLLLLIPRGLAFALWNLSLLIRIDQISRPENVSTNQALGQITVPSLAALLSGAPMGLVYDSFAPLVFFSVCGVMIGIGAAILWAGEQRKPKAPRLAVGD